MIGGIVGLVLLYAIIHCLQRRCCGQRPAEQPVVQGYPVGTYAMQYGAGPMLPSPRRTLFWQHSLGSAADRATAAQPLLRSLLHSNILAEAKWPSAAMVGSFSLEEQ